MVIRVRRRVICSGFDWQPAGAMIYIFDVDGTLTPARAAITRSCAELFVSFCRDRTVYLISGSDFAKLNEQLPIEVRRAVRGIFACAASEFLADGQLAYRTDHEFDPAVVAAIDEFIAASPYPGRHGRHIERRTGMINASVAGRGADPQQRRAYYLWDSVHRERDRFARLIAERFPGYEAAAGGEISVDVTPRGWTKARALPVLAERHPGEPITFFGDRVCANGNDLPLAEALAAAG